jgi:hypothetical protein
VKQAEWWKNFRLREELSVSGAFIYNGLRRFHVLHKLDHADDLLELFYHLCVGVERLMKIVIVLIEHDDAADQEAFEESLVTHNHQALLTGIGALGAPNVLLTTMMKTTGSSKSLKGTQAIRDGQLEGAGRGL